METGSVVQIKPLSPRQLEVVALVHQGLTYARIARRLDCAPKTVKVHVADACERLGIRGAERKLKLALWYERNYVAGTE